MNAMGNKIEEIIQASKLSELVKKDQEKKDRHKAVKIALCCIGGLIILGAIAYAVYSYFRCREEEYDLYDDLDNYYEEDDIDDAEILDEEDFAE